MNAEHGIDQIVERSPQFWARLAGFFYLLNSITSISSFSGKLSGPILNGSNWIATASYVTVVLILWLLFRPVSRWLSLVAAIFGWLGCADQAQWTDTFFHVHSLVFFGVYCTLLGVLILRSEFMPRLFGWLLFMAGAGWLTFVSPRLATLCSPYNYIGGGIGEIPLMLWLLSMGVNAPCWRAQAEAA